MGTGTTAKELRVKGYHVTVTIIALVLAGLFCLKPPAIPQWDADLTVPLYRGAFRLVDFLDSSLFFIQPDSTIRFAYDVPIDTVTPDGVIGLVSVDETNRIALGDFVFTDIPQGAVTVGIEDLLGYPIPDTGLKQQLEPFETTLPCTCSIPGVAYAEVLHGVLRTTVSNHTGIPIESLLVCFSFGQMRFDNLAPGTMQSQRTEIGGAVVSSPLALLVTVGSPGSAGDTVRLSKTDSLLVEIEVDSLQVANARIRIPIARGRRQCRVALGSSQPFEIDSLMLASGTCRILLANGFAVPVDAELTVPGLSQNHRRYIQGYQSTTVELDLAGVRVDNQGKTNSLLDFEVVAIPDPSDDLVDLAKGDGFVVGYETRELRAEYVAGEFRQPVYVTSVLETLPEIMPGGIKGMRVPNAELVLEIETSIGFPLEIQLGLVAHRDGAEAARLERELCVPAARPGVLGNSEWVLPVTDLVNAGADFITLEYTARMIGRGSYTAGSWLAGRASMSTPLRLAFVPDTIAGPSRRVELSESHRQRVIEYLVDGEAILTLRNRFPAGIGGWLVVTPDSTARPDPAALVDSILMPFVVPAGRVDGMGNCVGEQDTVIRLALDSAEVSLFQCNPLKAQVVFVLPETDTVVFRAGDRLQIQALLKLRVRVKEW